MDVFFNPSFILQSDVTHTELMGVYYSPFAKHRFCSCYPDVYLMYSRTSMARTSLGSLKLTLDMGSWSHIAPGQEANGDYLGMLFDLL